MDASIKGCLRSSFFNLLINVLFGFMEHLFNTCRVNTSVTNKILHSNAGDFTTNGIMSRNRYAFRSVVDDEVSARNLLKGTDIATLASNNATLQIVRRNMNCGYRNLRSMVCSQTLNRHA